MDLKRLETEAAMARKAAANTEATYRAERAQWVSDLDTQRLEVGIAPPGVRLGRGRGGGVVQRLHVPPHWRATR